MLDIGGFALSSMADHARSNGDEAAARKADKTGKFLIGIVILTLALITVGLLYPPAKGYTDGAEKVLILVRVVMTVVYGHVIHSLRRQSATLAIQPMQQANDDVIQELRSEVERLRTDLATQWSAETQQLRSQLQEVAALLVTQSVAKSETVSSMENETNIISFDDAKLHFSEASVETESVGSPRITVNLQRERKPVQRSTKNETNATRGTARQKALRILKKSPEMNATELAKRAGITPQYASQILKKQSV